MGWRTLVGLSRLGTSHKVTNEYQMVQSPEDYLFRYLPAHLLVAGRDAELHSLLATEDSEGRNAWFEAKQVRGELEDYVRDIGAGIQAASRLSDEDHGGAALGLRLRYSLMLSSVASRARNLPGKAGGALVTIGLWSPLTAVAYARQITEGFQKSTYLIALAASLPHDIAVEAARQAIPSARAVRARVSRACALANLASILAPEEGRRLLDEALVVALQVPTSSTRADTLLYLASRSPDSFLKEIYDSLVVFERKEAAVVALADLAGRLPADVRNRATSLALDTAGQSSDEHLRARVYVALARHIGKGDLETILLAARQFDNPEAKGLCLSGILPYTSISVQLALMPELWAALRSGRSADDVGLSLTYLAEWLPASELERALEVASAIRDEVWQTRALIALAPRLPAPLLSEAKTLADSIRHPAWRVRALLALADLFPELQAEELRTAAISAARVVRIPSTRAEMLVEVALRQPVVEQALIREALADSQDIGDELDIRLAQTLLVLLLGGEPALRIVSEVLGELGSKAMPAERIRLLIGLLPHLPEPWHVEAGQQAAVALADISEPAMCTEFTVALAPYLDESQLGQAADVALKSVPKIRNTAKRADAFTKLVPYLPSHLVPEALRLALKIAHPLHRVKTLCALIPRSVAPERQFLVEQALQAVRAIHVDADCAEALGYLSACGLPEREEELVALAEMIEDEPWRVEALAVLTLASSDDHVGPLSAAVYASARRVINLYRQPRAMMHLSICWAKIASAAEALDMAATIEDPVFRARALISLAGLLPENLFDRAIELATRVSWPQYSAEALLALLSHWPDRNDATLISQILAATVQVAKPLARAELLAGAVPFLARLSRQQGNGPWSLLIESWATQPRRDVMQDLAVMAPAIPASLGVYPARQIAQAVADVGRWWF
jgi:hypothetical protein